MSPGPRVLFCSAQRSNDQVLTVWFNRATTPVNDLNAALQITAIDPNIWGGGGGIDSDCPNSFFLWLCALNRIPCVFH